jgi:hypothetical protein
MSETELFQHWGLRQVHYIFAVRVVGAERQWLRLERERLLCFQSGGLVVHGRIKGGHAGRVESAAVPSGALARFRFPVPFWIVRSVDLPLKPIPIRHTRPRQSGTGTVERLPRARP